MEPDSLERHPKGHRGLRAGGAHRLGRRIHPPYPYPLPATEPRWCGPCCSGGAGSAAPGGAATGAASGGAGKGGDPDIESLTAEFHAMGHYMQREDASVQATGGKGGPAVTQAAKRQRWVPKVQGAASGGATEEPGAASGGAGSAATGGAAEGGRRRRAHIFSQTEEDAGDDDEEWRGPTIQCPNCGRIQRAGALLCWGCNVEIEYPDISDADVLDDEDRAERERAAVQAETHAAASAAAAVATVVSRAGVPATRVRAEHRLVHKRSEAGQARKEDYKLRLHQRKWDNDPAYRLYSSQRGATRESKRTNTVPAWDAVNADDVPA